MAETKKETIDLDLDLGTETTKTEVPVVVKPATKKTVKKTVKKVEEKPTPEPEVKEVAVNPYKGLNGDALLAARIKADDRITEVYYSKAYQDVRGYISALSINLVTYRFKVGQETLILKEHKHIVRQWLEEAHRAHGTEISKDPSMLAEMEVNGQ